MIAYLSILLLVLLSIRFDDGGYYDDRKWQEIDRLGAWWVLR